MERKEAYPLLLRMTRVHEGPQFLSSLIDRLDVAFPLDKIVFKFPTEIPTDDRLDPHGIVVKQGLGMAFADLLSGFVPSHSTEMATIDPANLNLGLSEECFSSMDEGKKVSSMSLPFGI